MQEVSMMGTMDKWVNATIFKLQLDEDKRPQLEDIYKKRFKPKKIKLYNSYTMKNIELNAYQLYKEIHDRGLIMNELGTLFSNQETILSPVTSTARELYDIRSMYKSKYKFYRSKEGYNPMLARRFNNLQGDVKIISNTYYGVQANVFSKFYNADVAASITAKCRTVTSVSALSVESMFNHVKYESLEEITHVAHEIMKEIKEDAVYHNHIMNLVLGTNITKEMLIEKIIEQTVHGELYREVLTNIIGRYDQTLIVRMFLKGNFKFFLSIPNVLQKIGIFLGTFDNSGIVFLNPYRLPNDEDLPEPKRGKGIAFEKPIYTKLTADLNVLSEIFHQACGCFYNTYRAKDKIDEMDRMNVAIMDRKMSLHYGNVVSKYLRKAGNC